jgi:predicted nucleic acid-binding protein
MNDKPFFDTNVVLYAFRQNDDRAQVAEALLAAGGTLSVQVLNEFVAVARRKLNRTWQEVRRALDVLCVFCPEPVPLKVETHERAVKIAERHGYSIIDSLIIAAALDAGATTLYSEDMRDGQTIDGLTIRNPFSDHQPDNTTCLGTTMHPCPSPVVLSSPPSPLLP